MNFPCVVLCSVRRTSGRPGGGPWNIEALVTRMKNDFGEYDAPLAPIEGYEVQDWGTRHVDGGNGGGGGDGGAAPPRFVRGYDHVGVWNFRECAPDYVKTDASRLISFPVAGRIELCIPFDSLQTAAKALSNQDNGAKLSYLRDIFVNIVLVPFARHMPAA